jgi:hypothetical protein
VNQMVPEIVRIGVANARIKCVTPQRVEYRDEAGEECFVNLDKCVRIPFRFHYEKEGDFVLRTIEGATHHIASRGAVPTAIPQNGSSLRTRDVPDLSLGLIKKPSIHCYNRSGRLAGIPK